MGWAFYTLLPLFLTIALGKLLKTVGLVRDEHWSGVDQLSFYVMFPVLMMMSLAKADLSGLPVFSMAAVMVSGMLSMQVFTALFAKPLSALLHTDRPSYTSVFQATGRWHTFIGLAIMPMLFGHKGLALGAIAAASIAPLSNASTIIFMSAYLSDKRPSVLKIARDLITNPFILAIITGALINFSGLKLPKPVADSLDLASAGALGIALMSVGAGLRFTTMAKEYRPVLYAVVAKLLILPLIMAGWCMIYDVTGLPRTITIIAGAVPTAAVSYIFARRLGGNSALMANIITVQIIASAITLPIIISLLAVE